MSSSIMRAGSCNTRMNNLEKCGVACRKTVNFFLEATEERFTSILLPE